ncbi:MAG TPA: hypothetical protein VHL34_12695 [Rhizomicrobium sp.]|nr:hypothetical protein [Rhizomicrobium sp.]
MKKVLMFASAVAFSAIGIIASSAPARADADDAKWVSQCIADNKDQGQPASVISSYCTCMNDKMPSDATQSITQWEKSHKAEADACSAQAGWK